MIDDYFDNVIDIARNLGFVSIENSKEEITTIKVSFREGNSDSNLHSLFLSKKMTNYLRKHKISFDDIGIVSHITAVDEPLLFIIYGDEELTKHEIAQFEKRREKGYATVPLVVFSESFFKIPYGEDFGYMNIMDNVSLICDLQPVAFPETQIINLHSNFDFYLWNIAAFWKMFNCRKLCKENIQGLIKQIYEIEKCISGNNLFRDRFIYEFVRESNNFIYKIKSIEKNIETKYKEISGKFQDIQEINLEEAVKRRAYFKGKPFTSAFSNKITLRYGDVRNLIDKLIDEMDKYPDKDSFVEDRINATYAILNNPCEMAIVGTFSSGKTTFINSLLGGKHNFRTSAYHNTAVLMVVEKSKDEKECYTIKYRKKIKYDVAIPSDEESVCQKYKEKKKAEVKRIDKRARLLEIQMLDTGERKRIDIENENEIVVQKGEILTYGKRLTEGGDKERNVERVKCISKGETEFLLTLLDDHKYVRNATISIEGKNHNRYRGRKSKKILESLIRRLENVSGKIYKVDDIFNTSELKGTGRITFECDYTRNDLKIQLSEDEWKKLCDATDAEVFMEKPECFVLSESLRINMNHSFLNYCRIIDTPGFGSITEKHDAITERYLREHKGILLIMIRIDNRPDKLSLHTLLNKIARIYNESDEHNKDHIYFMLNCYSNLAGHSSLIGFCKDVTEMIVRKGFSKERVYACNLKESIESGCYDTQQYGMPSYQEFVSSLKNDVEKRGILSQLRQIHNLWDMYLRDEKENTEKNKQKKIKDEHSREIHVCNLKRFIKNLENLEMKSYDKIIEDIEYNIVNLIGRIKTIEKKRDWIDEDSQKLILDAIDEINNQEDYITDAFNNAIFEVERNSDNHFIKTPLSPSEKKLFIFPAERIKDLYKDIGQRFWGIFYWKRRLFIEEMVSEIEEQKQISLDEYSNYYIYAKNIFDSSKTKVEMELNNEIKALSSDESMKNYIKKSKEKLAALEKPEGIIKMIEHRIIELER